VQRANATAASAILANTPIHGEPSGDRIALGTADIFNTSLRKFLSVSIRTRNKSTVLTVH